MHDHTGIPHDLPYPTPNAPLPTAWAKVSVYKKDGLWTWHHACPWKTLPVHGFLHMTHKIAMAFAWDHAKRCL